MAVTCILSSGRIKMVKDPFNYFDKDYSISAFSDDSDAPEDCHVHCDHYARGGTCCDCGEHAGPEEKVEATPIEDFIRRQGSELRTMKDLAYREDYMESEGE